MRVIATAGHVDHGKSTLVRALTGTDPDRLAEEKKRGLTIDLGFAGTTLAGGERIAFVDVPGHRRFIGNMLAGLGPAPVVMFVVAADQGWQAQSREHLDAVAALGLQYGLLVLTRCGLADRARIDQVRERAANEMRAAGLGGVRVVETDAISGQGVEELRGALEELVAVLPPVAPHAPVRLWVDRSFTIKGAGTVVTGTLSTGTVHVGDTLDLDGRAVTVRSLQVLGEDARSVGPVSRVAVGLRGIARGEVPRGTMLRHADAGRPARVIDVRGVGGLPWSEASSDVTVHIGTAALEAHIRPLDEEHARLSLADDLPWMLGDRLIVRDASAGRIHCGGVVLDVEPSPFTRRGEPARRAASLAEWTPRDAQALLEDRGCVSVDELSRLGARGLPQSATALSTQHGVRVHGYAVSAAQAQEWCERLTHLVAADADDPLSAGVAVRVVSETLGAPSDLVPVVVDLAELHIVDGRVVGPEHGGSLGAAEAALTELRARLEARSFDAPEADDLTRWGLGPRELAAAADRGKLLRLTAEPADIVLLPDAPARAMRVLASLPQPFTTSDARAALGTTRRVVIPLLEHLDARGWTRRDGNTRVVVR